MLNGCPVCLGFSRLGGLRRRRARDCEDAFAPSDALSYAGTQGKLWWNQDVDARSKTDEAEALACIELVPWLDMTDNSAREDTSDLLNNHV
jgi:hypothetical protein